MVVHRRFQRVASGFSRSSIFGRSFASTSFEGTPHENPSGAMPVWRRVTVPAGTRVRGTDRAPSGGFSLSKVAPD
jgi:hypothetical protein